jgi:hypothetical protein
MIAINGSSVAISAAEAAARSPQHRGRRRKRLGQAPSRWTSCCCGEGSHLKLHIAEHGHDVTATFNADLSASMSFSTVLTAISSLAISASRVAAACGLMRSSSSVMLFSSRGARFVGQMGRRSWRSVHAESPAGTEGL